VTGAGRRKQNKSALEKKKAGVAPKEKKENLRCVGVRNLPPKRRVAIEGGAQRNEFRDRLDKKTNDWAIERGGKEETIAGSGSSRRNLIKKKKGKAKRKDGKKAADLEKKKA